MDLVLRRPEGASKDVPFTTKDTKGAKILAFVSFLIFVVRRSFVGASRNLCLRAGGAEPLNVRRS